MHTSPSPVPTADSTALNVLEPSDGELMRRIQEADASALKEFFHRHRKMVKSVILRTVHDDANAEDVLQECLLELWQQCRHYSSEKGSPVAWFMTLCRRRSIDSLRRNMVYTRVKDRFLASLPPAELSDQISDECEQADLGRVLSQHLMCLPPAQREVICLSFLKGMSQREVARSISTPLGTVKTRLELGLRKLRQIFGARSALFSFGGA